MFLQKNRKGSEEHPKLGWQQEESDLLFVTEHSLLVLLEKIGHAGQDWLESWTLSKQLSCRFATQDARLGISEYCWSNIFSLTDSSCISGGCKEIQYSSGIQNLLGLVQTAT